jgi:hypothetical protein
MGNICPPHKGGGAGGSYLAREQGFKSNKNMAILNDNIHSMNISNGSANNGK